MRVQLRSEDAVEPRTLPLDEDAVHRHRAAAAVLVVSEAGGVVRHLAGPEDGLVTVLTQAGLDEDLLEVLREAATAADRRSHPR